MTTPDAESRAPQTTGSGPPQHRQEEASLGQIIGEVTADVQQLFRQELALAKAELRQQAANGRAAAGMLGGAGFAGYMVAVLASLAAVAGLAELMAPGWAALIITGVWAIVGLVLFVAGRNRLRDISPMPQQTIETLKEDAQWVRHPTK
jgi:hypothetical protein